MTVHTPIYLDYSATTPVDPRVAAKMIPYITEHFGNPASRSHPFGWTAEQAVEEAREEVAKLVNADPREIVWTSGATESNNRGLGDVYKRQSLTTLQLKVLPIFTAQAKANTSLPYKPNIKRFWMPSVNLKDKVTQQHI